MLPKQLHKILLHLNNLPTNSLNKAQKQLLDELEYLEDNEKIQSELEKYTYMDTLLESFTMAVGTCPTCGKKY